MSAGLKKPAVFWLIVIAVFFAGIYLLRAILLPFVAGMAVAYMFDPVCDRLERAGLSRTLATSVVTLGFVAILVLAVLLVLPVIVGQIASLIDQLPDYIESLRGQLASAISALESRLSPDIMARIRETLGASSGKIAGWITNLLTGLVTGGVALANLLSLIFITPVVSFYLLRDWDRIVAWVDACLPRGAAPAVREQTGLIDRTLAGWVRGQVTVCLVLGTFYAAALTLAGLDFGLVIGLLAGLLSFVPFVGAAVGLVGSVGLAVVQFDDWVRIAIVAASVVATIVLTVGLAAAGFGPSNIRGSVADAGTTDSAEAAVTLTKPKVVYVKPAPKPKTIVVDEKPPAKTTVGSQAPRKATTSVRAVRREREDDDRYEHEHESERGDD